MDDDFNVLDALNENAGAIGFAAGSAGLRGLAGIRKELENLKATVEKEADQRQLQAFLREKLFQFRQELDRIMPMEPARKRYAYATLLQEMFQESRINSSMLSELSDKDYLEKLRVDLSNVLDLSQEDKEAVNTLVSRYMLAASLPHLLDTQKARAAAEELLADLEKKRASAPSLITTRQAIVQGRSLSLRYAAIFTALVGLIAIASYQVRAHSQKRVLALYRPIDFGDVAVNSESTAGVTIANKGTQPLVVRLIRLPLGFSTEEPWTGTILPGSTQNIRVTFTPTAPTNYSGHIQVFSDATSGDSNLPVSARVVVPCARLRGNKEITDLNAEIDRRLEFPATKVGESEMVFLTIDNTSAVPLFVSSITCPAFFRADIRSSDRYSASYKVLDIPADESAIVPVVFTPQRTGIHSGAIKVYSNSPETVTIPVIADGI